MIDYAKPVTFRGFCKDGRRGKHVIRKNILLNKVGAFSVTLEPHVVDGDGLRARAAAVFAIDDL